MQTKSTVCTALLLVLVSGQVAFAQYTPHGELKPFWRYSAGLGPGHVSGQGLITVPEYLCSGNDFAYQRRPYAKESMFADHLSLVRLLGGYLTNETRTIAQASEMDLVHRDNGEVKYKMELVEPRLRPYLDAGYTNLTLVLDNIPWGMTDAPEQGNYGNVGIPYDFDVWEDFMEVLSLEISNVCGVAGAENFRFRTGTEFQGIQRYHGTGDADFMGYYNASWRGISNVFPNAEFGPFNIAGVSVNNLNNNPNINAFNIPALKDPSAPFSWVCYSHYFLPGESSAKLINPFVEVWDEFERLYPGIEFSKEIHEFGLQPWEDSKTGQIHQEPGASGITTTLQVLLGLWDEGLDRCWHWGVIETYRNISNKNLYIPEGHAWIYSVLERMKGGEAHFLEPVNSSSHGTYWAGMSAQKETEALLLLNAYNTDNTRHTPESATFRIPKNATAPLDLDRLQYTAANKGTVVHDVMFDDLQQAGLLYPFFANNPEYRGLISEMAYQSDPASNTREGMYFLAESYKKYEQVWHDSLTLKPISERVFTITDEGTYYQVSIEINVPESLVIWAPVLKATTIQWAAPAVSGNWDEAAKWNPQAVPGTNDSVFWPYDRSYPEIKVDSPVNVFQFTAAHETGTTHNKDGGLKILHYGANSGSIEVGGGAGLLNMQNAAYKGARLYLANDDPVAAADIVNAAFIDAHTFTVGTPPGASGYYTHENGMLNLTVSLLVGDATVAGGETVLRQSGGQIHVKNNDYALRIGTAAQPGRFVLDGGCYSGGLTFHNTNSVFELNAGRVQTGNRNVVWGGINTTAGTVLLEGNGIGEINVDTDNTLIVKPMITFADKPGVKGDFVKTGAGTLLFQTNATINLSGSIRIEDGTLELQTTNLNPWLAVALDPNGMVNLNFSGTAVVQRISFDSGQTWQGAGTVDNAHAQVTGTGVLELRDPYCYWADPAAGGSWSDAASWVDNKVPSANAGAYWGYTNGEPVVDITTAVEVADLIASKVSAATQDNKKGLYIHNYGENHGSLTVKDGLGTIDFGVDAALRVYNDDPSKAADIINASEIKVRGLDISTLGGTGYFTHETGNIEANASVTVSGPNDEANRCEFRQTGGSIIASNASFGLQLGNKKSAGTFILDGGTSAYTIYFKGTGSSYDFNDGTWRSGGKDYVWKANVGYGGNVRFAGTGTHAIDVQGGQTLTVTPDVALTDKPGEAGSFIKTGDGIMLVQSGIQLSGQMDVSGGTLTIGTNNINSNLIVLIGSSATLNLDFVGTAAVHALSFDGGETWAAPGTWGVAGADNSSPLLAGSGMLLVGTDQLPPKSWTVENFSEEQIANGIANETVDADGDGYSNWEEFIIGSDPTAASSSLNFGLETGSALNGVSLFFTGAVGRIYTAYVCTNLVENMWDVLQHGVIGDAPVAIDDEDEHPNAFYQMEIALP